MTLNTISGRKNSLPLIIKGISKQKDMVHLGFAKGD